jgi:hypothetical protein
MIRVHSFVGEVGSGVLRVGEFSNLGFREVVVARVLEVVLSVVLFRLPPEFSRKTFPQWICYAA